MTLPSEREFDDLVWHYTSTAGLRGIVTSDSIWATSAAFMNDANEMKTGVNALKSTFAQMEGSLSEADRDLVSKSSLLRGSSVFDSYLVSASALPDLLTLWRGYGTGQVAYAVGLDRARRLVPREQIPGDEHPCPPPGYRDGEVEEIDDRPVRLYDSDSVFVFGGEWKDVKYVSTTGTPDHERQIRDFIAQRKAAIERGAFLIDVGPNVDGPINHEKDDGFIDEREVRVIVGLNPVWKFVKFREGRFGLIPYIEMAAGAANAEYALNDTPMRLPIDHIKIGPSPDPESALRALRAFLDSHGYGSTEISASSIPSRQPSALNMNAPEVLSVSLAKRPSVPV
ncbi:hypothetical protein [Cryobacterium sp. TMT1-66-1]|uniref:hypothetical protein n=1 Tax=Cryobacterium sp. TMT1-66-1 TaxID=1259242 RepID=UPI00106C6152|nr:hypothetical protein [Cryobacterium sp. TMT1-66-1]TFD08215.1 hypothetical protein E3T29_05630 [Cryobacterium sp. TMT1-66-1]